MGGTTGEVSELVCGGTGTVARFINGVPRGFSELFGAGKFSELVDGGTLDSNNQLQLSCLKREQLY
jgi:hypothetical protein